MASLSTTTTPTTADRSLWFLLFSNLLAAAMALLEGWQLGELLWIYWGQSVVIGVFSFRRILDLRRFSTEGFRVNGRSVAPTEETKRQTAGFFLMHYGLFHLVYFVFLAASLPRPGLVLVVAGWLVFGIHHALSYRLNREADRGGCPNIGTVMFLPYARVVPMHLMIVLGLAFAGGSGALLLFLVLKTGADMLMHVVEHRLLAKPAAGPPGGTPGPA